MEEEKTPPGDQGQSHGKIYFEQIESKEGMSGSEGEEMEGGIDLETISPEDFIKFVEEHPLSPEDLPQIAMARPDLAQILAEMNPEIAQILMQIMGDDEGEDEDEDADEEGDYEEDMDEEEDEDEGEAAAAAGEAVDEVNFLMTRK